MICSLVQRALRIVKLCFSVTLFLNLTLTPNNILTVSIDTHQVITQERFPIFLRFLDNFFFIFFFFFFSFLIVSLSLSSSKMLMTIRYISLSRSLVFEFLNVILFVYFVYFIYLFIYLKYRFIPYVYKFVSI